jgi:hypothetical protein
MNTRTLQLGHCMSAERRVSHMEAMHNGFSYREYRGNYVFNGEVCSCGGCISGHVKKYLPSTSR